MLSFKESPGALRPLVSDIEYDQALRSSLSLVTAPASEPVTMSQFKLHARISRDDEDSLIDGLLRAARTYVEAVQRRQLITATWRLTLDAFPCWEIRVPLPPLQSVSSITYLDNNGATQTLSPSVYLVDNRSQPGRITPAFAQYWPATRYQANAVTVTFVAGYGPGPDDVPDTTRQAIKLLTSHWYENREPSIQGTITAPLAYAVDALLSAESYGGYQ